MIFFFVAPRVAFVAFILLFVFAFTSSSSSRAAPEVASTEPYLVGTDTGLGMVDATGIHSIWNGGAVYSIVPVKNPTLGWYFVTSAAVLFSADLLTFEDRSAGLPKRVLKTLEMEAKAKTEAFADVLCLAVDPRNSEHLAACTNSAVFESKDGGLSWKGLGSPSIYAGLKAASFAFDPKDGMPALWVSHTTKGLFFKTATGGWKPFKAGLELGPGTSSPEEISSFAISQGDQPLVLFAANSFLPVIKRLSPKETSFSTIRFSDSEFETIESLSLLIDNSLRFVTSKGVLRIAHGDTVAVTDQEAQQLIAKAFDQPGLDKINTLAWWGSDSPDAISGLWQLHKPQDAQRYASLENKEGIYVRADLLGTAAAVKQYDALMDVRHLNTTVIDMKDESGRVRFQPTSARAKSMGKVARLVDIKTLIPLWKSKNRHLIARIPVFKDQAAWHAESNRFALWDGISNKPWMPVKAGAVPVPVTLKATNPANPDSGDGATSAAIGAQATASPAVVPAAAAAAVTAATTAAATASTATIIGEYWVDPYCEEVWKYNVAIAQDLAALGFDEIQFDYVRFPTDGKNLDAIRYRWREPQMTKEGALASFLKFARASLNVPISIDVYGANAWYRSGLLTGQDIDFLSNFVDVICPMFYPSHFDQDFLAHTPSVLRPWRIYYTGSLRAQAISRNRILIRPYIQAFYLNVSYDKTYYNKTYVEQEIRGVRESVDSGFTFWNNSGRYDEVPVLSQPASSKANSALLD